MNMFLEKVKANSQQKKRKVNKRANKTESEEKKVGIKQ